MGKILLLLLFVISFSVQATNSDELCIKNHVFDSYTLSIGVKVFRNNKPVIKSKKGEPVPIKWGKEYYINTNSGDTVSIYKKSVLSNWKCICSYQLNLLGGTELIIDKKGWFGAEDCALKYTPNQKNDYQPASWMSQLFAKNANIRLRDICIPGTHASGSYQSHRPITLDPVMSDEWSIWREQFDNSITRISDCFTTVNCEEYFFNWLTRTQSVPVSKQLSLGARYLEMKVVPHKEDFFTARGVLGQPVDIILADVKDFIRKNPGEIVLLHFSDTSALNKNDHRRLFEKISATLEDLLISADYGTDITAGEIYQTPGRVMVFYQSTTYKIPSWLWSNKEAKQFGVETNDADLLLKEIAKKYRCSAYSLFEITIMHLTPAEADIYDFNNMFTQSFSKGLAGKLKYPSGIVQYFSKAAQQCGRRLNIVSHDYIERSDLFDSCMAINQDLLEPGYTTENDSKIEESSTASSSISSDEEDVLFDRKKVRAESMQQNSSETEPILSKSDEMIEEELGASSEEKGEVFSADTTSIPMNPNLYKRRVKLGASLN